MKKKMNNVVKNLKKYWSNKKIEINYESKYEKALDEIDDLKNQIKFLKRKLSSDYKTNLNEELRKQLIREKQINENLRQDNLKLMRKK